MKPYFLLRLFAVSLSLLLTGLISQAQIHFRHYTPAHYYDLSGTKHTGFVDFGANAWGTLKINFKSDSLAADNQKINLSDIKSIVLTPMPDSAALAGGPKVATDSLVVVQEADESFDAPTSEPRLCNFITDAVNAKIYSRGVKKNGPGFAMGMGSIGALSVMAGASISYTDTVYLCELEGKAWEIKRKNYRELLTKAFADYPELVQQIQNKEIKFGQLEAIIKKYVAHKTA